MKRIAALTILSFCIATAFAQDKAPTTYANNAPFTCDSATHYPYQITSFNQFSCRGIHYCTNGPVVSNTSPCQWGDPNYIELFFAGPSRIELFTPAFGMGPYYSTLTLTGFTQPTAAEPGTFSFTWSGLDETGVQRSGTGSGTWKTVVVCGGRGCAWDAPQIESSTLTVN